MLYIYPDTDSESPAFSTEGDLTNPMTAVLDTNSKAVFEKRVFVRSSEFSYTGIIVQPVCIAAERIDGTAGFGVKIIKGNARPVQTEWEETNYANEVSLDDISDTNTYLPIWIRFEAPRGASVDSFTDVQLQTTYTEVT